MREIKFRAWDSNFKKWIRLNGRLDNTFWSEGSLCGIQSYIFLQQYTGLKDKNGKEIYEGDILRWNETGYVASVRYEGGWFVVGECGEPIMLYVQEAIEDDEFDTKKDCRNSDIIGNIYESSELLKTEATA